MSDSISTYINPLTDFGFKYIFALNDKDKKAYKESLKPYRDSYAIAETERAEGRAKGRAEGRVEGKNEERRESFRTMLSLGIDPGTIAEKYGITSEEVIGLAKI